MEKSASFKNFIIALLIGLGGAFAGAFSPVLLIAAAAGMTFLYVCLGKSYAFIAAFFTLLGIFFGHLGNDVTMYALWGAFSFFAMFTALGFARRVPYRFIAFALAAAGLIALYLGIGLPSLILGKAPYEGILDMLRSLNEYYSAAGYASEGLNEIIEALPTMFYGMLVLFAEAAAFFTVTLAHLFCSLAKADIRPMARFREWQLPFGLRIGIPVFAAAIIIMYAAGFGAAPVVLSTVLYMLLPPLAAAGAATVVYVASRGRDAVSLPVRIFVIFAALLSPYFMAIVGAVDLYAGIRRRLIRTDRLIREAFEKANREHSNTVTVDFGDGNGPRIIAVRKTSEAFFDNESDDENGESGENGENGENAPQNAGDGANNADNSDAAENGENSESNDNNDNNENNENDAKETKNTDGGDE